MPNNAINYRDIRLEWTDEQIEAYIDSKAANGDVTYVFPFFNTCGVDSYRLKLAARLAAIAKQRGVCVEGADDFASHLEREANFLRPFVTLMHDLATHISDTTPKSNDSE